MTAVEEYEHMKQDRLGSETPILASVIAMYADKAIDELEDTRDAALSLLEVAEAETDRVRTLFQKSKNAMKRAEREVAQKELVCTRLRTSWREDTADLGDFDAALHSAFQDYRDDFPDGSIGDFDKWLACHVECGKEMLAP